MKNAYSNGTIRSILTLFLSGRGHYGPGHHERPRCFRRVRATTTKIHDFVSVYVWMVPWESFLGFVFKIFEKRKNIFLTISKLKYQFFKRLLKCALPTDGRDQPFSLCQNYLCLAVRLLKSKILEIKHQKGFLEFFILSFILRKS